MIDNDGDFPITKSGQFVLSYELLCLLRWLAQHDTSKLKKIIAQAVANGLQSEMQKKDTITELHAIAEDMQDNIIDFFGLLEVLLLESINQHAEQKAREKNLMPAIDQIDTSLCDNATVRLSVQKTTTKLEHNPNINPKEQFFEELLKRWDPHNKQDVLN